MRVLVWSPRLYAALLSAGYPTALSESMDRKSCKHQAVLQLTALVRLIYEGAF